MVSIDKENLSHDSIIINGATAVKHCKNRRGYGIIARSCEGSIKAVWALRDTKVSAKSAAEAEVTRFAIIRAKMEGWNSIIVQDSYDSIVEKIRKGNTNDVHAAVILEDIRELQSLFASCSFYLVSKDHNIISSRLAKFALDLKQDVEWKDSFPS